LLGSSFAVEKAGFLLGRAPLSFSDAKALVASLQTGLVPAVGSVPEAQVDAVEPPSTPIRVFPHHATEAGRLSVLAARPLRAFLFRIEAPAIEIPFPSNWDIGTQNLHAPDRWEAGIAADSAPRGFLIGRLEPRAWLRNMRGADDANLHYYEVSIGLAPDRIAPHELAVELREWVDEELASARRLSLDWLELSAWTGQDHLELTLPMFGAGGKRSVALYDLGGELLDLSDAVYLVESIHIKMSLLTPSGEAATEENLVVGTKLTRSLSDRLARRKTMDEEYRQLVVDGLPNRVVLAGGQAALAYLRSRLETGRGEIRVMDRYFGRDASEWQLLDQLHVPVRVLVSNPGHPPPRRAGLTVRQWAQPQRGAVPPFHDRLYLWDGGGITVGTSPGGLGLSDSRIDSLDPAEVAALTVRFDQLWTSPEFAAI
jgi:hypothetical protein